MLQIFKQTARMASLVQLPAVSRSLFEYTPRRFILHDAKRLKTKPKYQEFEM